MRTIIIAVVRLGVILVEVVQVPHPATRTPRLRPRVTLPAQTARVAAALTVKINIATLRLLRTQARPKKLKTPTKTSPTNKATNKTSLSKNVPSLYAIAAKTGTKAALATAPVAAVVAATTTPQENSTPGRRRRRILQNQHPDSNLVNRQTHLPRKNKRANTEKKSGGSFCAFKKKNNAEKKNEKNFSFCFSPSPSNYFCFAHQPYSFALQGTDAEGRTPNGEKQSVGNTPENKPTPAIRNTKPPPPEKNHWPSSCKTRGSTKKIGSRGTPVPPKIRRTANT